MQPGLLRSTGGFGILPRDAGLSSTSPPTAHAREVAIALGPITLLVNHKRAIFCYFALWRSSLDPHHLVLLGVPPSPVPPGVGEGNAFPLLLKL